MLSTKAWNYSRSFEGHNRRKNTITLQSNLFATLLDKYFFQRRKSVSLTYLSLLFETRNASLKAVFFSRNEKKGLNIPEILNVHLQRSLTRWHRKKTPISRMITIWQMIGNELEIFSNSHKRWSINFLAFATFNPKFGNFDHKFYS